MKKITYLMVLFMAWSYGQTDYSHKIQSLNQFITFQGEPLSNKFSNIKSVKVIYSFSDKKVYFFDSVKYKYHYNFCNEALHYNQELGVFNDRNYSPTNDREFLLGNLNRIENSDDWILELAASDLMNETLIKLLFKEIKQNVYFGNKLKFYLSTPRLIELNAEKKLPIPTVFSDFIFKNITEQSIEKAQTVGILKKYDLQNKKDFYPKSDEIVIINTTPEIIPDVKGIIITELQTPLSHLVLLAKNRNIPVYVNTKAWNDKKLNALLGKKVLYTVHEDHYTLKETSKPIKANQKRDLIPLERDLSVRKIVNLNSAAPKNGQKFIGTKAQNLAYLNEISKEFKQFKTPEYLYAVPFYFYEEHIRRNHLQEKIDSLFLIPRDCEKSSKIHKKGYKKSPCK